MACQYSKEQILGQLMSMSPTTTNAWRWASWWVVYDLPDGGIPPAAPANVNEMNLVEVSDSLYRCYCLHECPDAGEERWPGICK